MFEMGPMSASQSEAGLFKEVVFTVIESRDLEKDFAHRLISLLEVDGAKYIPVEPLARSLPLNDITHIISNTIDFPGYDDATDALVPVVKSAWVAACLEKRRLAQVRAHSPDPRLFFSGITISCADIPNGDKEAIIGGVTAMGGQYSGALSKMVTHIVALTEDNDLYQQATKSRMKVITVLPHWFDDCLKLGKRIDERPYRLPRPPLTHDRADDPVDFPKNPSIVGATSPQPDSLPTPNETPSPSRRELRVFFGKKAMLSSDLDLGHRLRKTIEGLIVSGGGSITASISKADMLICQYRDGNDYISAFRHGKDVGSLSWLYYLITHNTWTSPLRRLLHYPVAREGLPGFKDNIVSVSNYGGEARLYLENLITAAGGKFTKTLRQENTHLITAREFSEKVTAAREWGIETINHLWLEESYAKWRVQTLTNPRYTHFPARTNLGEVVGQTQIDRSAIEGTVAVLEDDEATASEDDVIVMDDEEELHGDVLQRKTPFSSSDAQEQQPDQSMGVGKLSLGTSIPRRSGSKTANPTKVDRKAQVYVTPSKFKATGIEMDAETPGSTGSRSAKDRAINKLHTLAPDIALYEKERKRVGGVERGGKKVKEDMVDPNRKRSMSHETEGDDSDLDAADTRGGKRLKKTKVPISIRLLTTGYQRWIGKESRELADKRALRELGILIVSDPATCTHLAAPSIVRTAKFVSAIARAPKVVSLAFVDYCLENSSVPSEKQFLLKDSERESKLGFKIQDSLKRAKQNNGKLLGSVSLYCTPMIKGGFDTFKAIVLANGGKCVAFRTRATAGRVATVTRDEVESGTEAGDDTDDEEWSGKEEVVYLLSGMKPEEKALWERFEHMAKEEKRISRIVSTDWLLDAAMSQTLKDAGKYLLK